MRGPGSSEPGHERGQQWQITGTTRSTRAMATSRTPGGVTDPYEDGAKPRPIGVTDPYEDGVKPPPVTITDPYEDGAKPRPHED